ncbi:MAG: ABC transporter substrate-binding protein [bacterium]|nr:ABC transporter substrate-binding protein [bacterium]
MKYSSNRRARLGFLAVIAVTAFIIAPRGWSDETAPYKRMLDDPLEFTGPSLGTPTDEIRIGLFSPPPESGSLARGLISGAILAASEANDANPCRSFRIMRRWADDPWSGGAREIVRLIYDDGVLALVGSTGSAETHLLEQIALKAFVPVIAPLSTDETLNQTRVPWIFRLPPGEDRIAQILIQGLNGCETVGLAYSTRHDARSAAEAMRKALAHTQKSIAFEAVVTDDPASIKRAIADVLEFKPDAVWTCLPDERRDELLRESYRKGAECRWLLPWKADRAMPEWFHPTGGAITVDWPPLSECESSGNAAFAARYQKRFHEAPNRAAMLGYDAVRLIVEGVRAGGVTRSVLRERIAGLNDFTGVSGAIRWDNGGSNIGSDPVVKINVPFKD